MTPPLPALPADDLSRELTLSDSSNEAQLIHLGVTGDNYTILLSGEQTAGRFCLIEMRIPPGGGPGLHRHDFEESFVLLSGELSFTFRDQTHLAKAGTTVNVPANAPHKFKNTSAAESHLFCICSPAGQEEFFTRLGVRLPSRNTPAPALSSEEMSAFLEKATQLAPLYRTELLGG